MRIIKQWQPAKFLRFRSQPFWSFYHLFYFVSDGGLDISENVLHIRHWTLPNILVVVTDGCMYHNVVSHPKYGFNFFEEDRCLENTMIK